MRALAGRERFLCVTQGGASLRPGLYYSAPSGRKMPHTSSIENREFLMRCPCYQTQLVRLCEAGMRGDDSDAEAVGAALGGLDGTSI